MTVDELLTRLRAAARDFEDAAAGPGPQAQAWPPAAAPAAAPLADALRQAQAGAGLGAMLALDTAAFLDAAYALTLGRPADAAGRADALSALDAGLPRLGLLMRLHASPEAAGRRPAGWRWSDAVARLALSLLDSRLPALPRLARGLLHALEARLRARARPALALAQALAATGDARLARLEAEAARRGARHDQALAGLDARLARLEAAVAEAAALAGSTVPRIPALDAYLLALEAHFRGDPAALQAQMAADYGPALDALAAADPEGLAAPCLDLGCGRGVWLELLARRGFRAQGLDLNPAAVAEARARGLEAEVGDALAALRARPAGSVLMVTAFHLIEHLPLALRLGLVAEAARVLRPGGLLILETPNPENIWVATHTYHHDPTHLQPLTPAGLAFLAGHVGLTEVEVLRLHPLPGDAGLPVVDATSARLNHMTCGAQDFAVLARKPRPGRPGHGDGPAARPAAPHAAAGGQPGAPKAAAAGTPGTPGTPGAPGATDATGATDAPEHPGHGPAAPAADARAPG